MPPSFMQALDPDIAEKLRSNAATRTYPARSYIFYEGDVGSGVFIVESGLLRIDRTTSDGRVVLLDLASKGELIGDLAVIDPEPRSATLSTVTNCTMRHVNADAFRTLIRDTDGLQLALLTSVTRRLRELTNQFMENSIMNAPARVASRLMRLVEIEQALGRSPLDSDGVIDLRLPISQEELGQWAGLSREGAVKGLTTLRSIGLIETGRKRVRILDIKRLQDHI